MPKGKQLKQNCPTGMINVVSKVDFSDNLICQKPELAPSSVKIFAPCSYAGFTQQIEEYDAHDTHSY